jgi:hypothetical protein
MHLNPAAFNAHLAHIGQQFSWQKAYDCPCISPHSGAASPTCTRCSGKGTVWAAAVEGTAGVAGQKVQREWAQFGVWERGDVVLTLPSDSPLYGMGQFDRVIMLNASTEFSLNLTRGQNDKLKFPVLSVARVFWYDGDDTVEGGIPTVGADGTLTWESGEPPAGTVFSISGTKRPEYYCFGDFPSNRNMHSGAALPKRIVLRLFDLYNRR